MSCKVVCEIGCNHQGDINIAKEMIRQAKLAGSDYCKFQKRDIDNHPEWKTRPYENKNSFGKTYYDHRKYLELSIEQHSELKQYCEEISIGYSCSVWDIQSAKDIIQLNPNYIKIPSALNDDYDLLEYVYSNYDKNVHISVGMATEDERSRLYDYVMGDNDYVMGDKEHRTVIYWTTSEYPCSFENLFLNEIERLLILFKTVGYSGHHLGIAVDICAFTLGASWIERHFTLDRTSKGTDHSASLEPFGLQKLCRDLNAAEKSLNYKGDDLTDGEKINKEKLR